MKKTIFRIMTLATVFATVVFTGCKKDDDKKEEEVPAPVVETFAKIKVIHASPNAPGVDLLVDNVKVNPTALNYPSSTEYLSVKSGARNIKVNVTGTSDTRINETPNLDVNKNYSIFAIDSVDKLSPLVLVDDLTSPAAGKAHVRFIHLSPNAPAVDIAITNSTVLFPNTIFKGDKPFTPLNAGTYNLEVRVAGTVPPATPAVLLLPNITLTAGKIYTVFAKGFLGGIGAQALGAEIIVNN